MDSSRTNANTSIYTYLNNIPKDSQFNYLAIIALITAFVFHILKPSLLTVIAVAVAVIVVWIINEHRTVEITDFNKEIELRLNTILPKTKYFYIDVDIINIFYNIKEFREYNFQTYDNAVKATDNFLRVVRDIMELGVQDCVANLEVAEEQYKLAINYLQSMIFSTPATEVTEKKYKNAVDTLQLILRRHIDEMAEKCKESQQNRRLNITDRFYDNTQPKQDDTTDPTYNNGFTFF